MKEWKETGEAKASETPGQNGAEQGTPAVAAVAALPVGAGAVSGGRDVG
jgi:hypothetical protein